VGGEWRSAPPEKKFLYALFLAIDANFRMKRKQVSSEEADPGLNLGSAFFSDVKAYMQHVGGHWEEEQEVGAVSFPPSCLSEHSDSRRANVSRTMP
jgi:hypothetical protein